MDDAADAPEPDRHCLVPATPPSRTRIRDHYRISPASRCGLTQRGRHGGTTRVLDKRRDGSLRASARMLAASALSDATRFLQLARDSEQPGSGVARPLWT